MILRPLHLFFLNATIVLVLSLNHSVEKAYWIRQCPNTIGRICKKGKFISYGVERVIRFGPFKIIEFTCLFIASTVNVKTLDLFHQPVSQSSNCLLWCISYSLQTLAYTFLSTMASYKISPGF